MTGRETPSPDSVPRLLEEAGIAEDPALVHAVRSIAALGGRPAPDASAELAQLMADGGRALQSRRNKRRITFIGGALAVSMGAGMSGVAAGTLHLREGFDDAVVSITRFTVRNDVDRAEPAPGPLADAGQGHGTAVVPAVPAPVHTPAPSVSAPASAPAGAGGPLVPAARSRVARCGRRRRRPDGTARHPDGAARRTGGPATGLHGTPCQPRDPDPCAGRSAAARRPDDAARDGNGARHDRPTRPGEGRSGPAGPGHARAAHGPAPAGPGEAGSGRSGPGDAGSGAGQGPAEGGHGNGSGDDER